MPVPSEDWNDDIDSVEADLDLIPTKRSLPALVGFTVQEAPAAYMLTIHFANGFLNCPISLN